MRWKTILAFEAQTAIAVTKKKKKEKRWRVGGGVKGRKQDIQNAVSYSIKFISCYTRKERTHAV